MFPDEIWLRIFGHLANVDLLKTEAVCRKFARLARCCFGEELDFTSLPWSKNRVKEIYLSDANITIVVPRQATLEGAIAKHARLATMTILKFGFRNCDMFITAQLMKFIRNTCPNLHTLQFCSSERHVYFEASALCMLRGSHETLSINRTVVNLRVDGFTAVTVKRGFKQQLKTVLKFFGRKRASEITRVSSERLLGVSGWLSMFPNLEAVSLCPSLLKNPPGIYYQALLLRSLSICDLPEPILDGLIHTQIATIFPNLEELKMDRLVMENYNPLLTLSKLRSLYLSFTFWLSWQLANDKLATDVVSTWPALEEFTFIDKFQGDWGFDFSALSNLHNLTILHLEARVSLFPNKHSIFEALRANPKLQRLCIISSGSGRRDISFSSSEIQEIGKMLPNLKYFCCTIKSYNAPASKLFVDYKNLLEIELRGACTHEIMVDLPNFPDKIGRMVVDARDYESGGGTDWILAHCWEFWSRRPNPRRRILHLTLRLCGLLDETFLSQAQQYNIVINQVSDDPK